MTGTGTRELGVFAFGRASFIRGVPASGTGSLATDERTGTLRAEKTGTLEKAAA